MASRVVNDLPLLYRAAAIKGIRLHQRRPRGIDLHLERNPELFAVAEHGPMDGGNTRRAGIQVKPFLPIAVLDGPIGEFDGAAVANGPVSPARTLARFQQRAVEAGLPQLV